MDSLGKKKWHLREKKGVRLWDRNIEKVIKGK
jgi:hypothetical protein